ncbi:MAG: FixH family protein, partial [Sulfuricaulis sp.]|nr:FixH family protein [Sulfuricaulis sp.]
MTLKRAPARPWYREPFVWLLIAFPLTAVIVGFVSLALAIRSDDGMVEDDYYKQGMTINRVLERDKAAAAQDLTGTVELDAARHELLVRLTARQALALPDNIQIKLMHATRAGFDRSLVLPRHADGTYRAPLPEFVP